MTEYNLKDYFSEAELKEINTQMENIWTPNKRKLLEQEEWLKSWDKYFVSDREIKNEPLSSKVWREARERMIEWEKNNKNK